MWRLLAHGRFRTVWVGESVSMLGRFSFDIAFAWLVLSTTNSATTLAGVMIAAAVPRGLLLLPGGVITDRVSPRIVMLTSHLSRGFLVVALLALLTAGAIQTWHFYAIAALFGVADAFFWPASSSIIPFLVRSEELPQANAMVGVSEQTTRLVGPALSGALVAFTSSYFTISLTAASFFAAAFTVLAAPRRVEMPEATSWHWAWAEMKAGLLYTASNVEIRSVLLPVSAAALTYGGLFGVGLPAFSVTFDRGSLALGMMVSAWGLGQLIGAISAGITGLPRKWGILIGGMSLCEGAGFALLGFVHNFWVVSAVLLVLGFGVAYSTDVALPVWIQTRTPRDLLGRINSVIKLPRVALEPLSMAAMGFLISANVRWAFFFASLPMLLAGIILIGSKTVRGLETRAYKTPWDQGV